MELCLILQKNLVVVLLLVLLCGSMGLAEKVFAHGTDYRILDKADTITVECMYDDGEPMQYAEVTLFSPADSSLEYQNGRTDQQGRFAFYPSSAGKWRMEVSDGMGHAVHARIDVVLQEKSPGGQSGMAASPVNPATLFGGSSRFLKAVLGVSLVMNIFLGMSVLKKNK